MKKAIEQAKKAYQEGEVPVGCVIVKDGVIISRGRNQIEKKRSVLAYAELLAISKAEKKLNSRRLSGCTMYVTLEPCPMCAGAIMNARVPRVYIGAKDRKGGAYGGLLDLNSFSVNHKPDLFFGILEKECSDILSEFFRKKR